jgi:hypothetical protein
MSQMEQDEAKLTVIVYIHIDRFDFKKIFTSENYINKKNFPSYFFSTFPIAKRKKSLVRVA